MHNNIALIVLVMLYRFFHRERQPKQNFPSSALNSTKKLIPIQLGTVDSVIF